MGHRSTVSHSATSSAYAARVPRQPSVWRRDLKAKLFVSVVRNIFADCTSETHEMRRRLFAFSAFVGAQVDVYCLVECSGVKQSASEVIIHFRTDAKNFGQQGNRGIKSCVEFTANDIKDAKEWRDAIGQLAWGASAQVCPGQSLSRSSVLKNELGSVHCANRRTLSV